MCHDTVISDRIMNIKLWCQQGITDDVLLDSLSRNGLISRVREYMPCQGPEVSLHHDHLRHEWVRGTKLHVYIKQDTRAPKPGNES